MRQPTGQRATPIAASFHGRVSNRSNPQGICIVDRMSIRIPIVFVIELPRMMSFAFEAANEAQAKSFANAAWFAAAVDNYLRSRSTGLPLQDFAPRIRPATDEELSVYRSFAREFADLTDCVLVVPTP